MPSFSEIYRSVRKPVAPPTRVERDRREEIRRKEDEREVEKHKGRGRGRGGRGDEG